MMNIAFLENQLQKAQRVLDEKRASVSNNVSAFEQASLLSFESHVKALQTKLRFAKITREKEILDIRFIGELANNGALPLSLHGLLSTGIADSLISLSTTLKGGVKKKAHNEADIDLRLASIASGSTRFILTLNINPDFFGWSLSQNTLERWFDIFFGIENNDENVFDSIHSLGDKGLKGMKKFLSTLSNNNLEVDLAWNSHFDKKFLWNGDKDKILKTIEIISSISTESPIETQLIGKIYLLDRSGKISIKGIDDNEIIKINFPNSMLNEIEKLHINQLIRINALKTITHNQFLNKTHCQYDAVELI